MFIRAAKLIATLLLEGRRQVHFAPTVSIAEADSSPEVPKSDLQTVMSATPTSRSRTRGRRTRTGFHAIPQQYLAWIGSSAVILSIAYLLLAQSFCSGLPTWSCLKYTLSDWNGPIAPSWGRSVTRLSMRDHVQKAIRIALESTVQRHNFASAQNGGRVVTSLTHYDSFPSRSHHDSTPDSLLTDGLSMDSCWTFSGQNAQVAIRLPQKITPTHVAIDVATRVLVTRAPRHVLLWGVVDGGVNKLTYEKGLKEYRETVAHRGTGPAQSNDYTFLLLADFVYDPAAAFPLQTFPIAQPVIASQITFGLLVAETRSNWGGGQTSICRVLIHGERNRDL